MEFICKYCGKVCKNNNSLRQHEIRCKSNQNHIECFGNKGNMPKHKKSYYINKIKTRDGLELDITGKQLEEYRETHQVCEICGKPINDCVKWNSKNAPKNFCVDHDHKTNKFRGLLCLVCNRQLGWYENNKDAINDYLNKK